MGGVAHCQSLPSHSTNGNSEARERTPSPGSRLRGEITGTGSQVLRRPTQRLVRTATPWGEILESQEIRRSVPLPAGGPQPVTAFVINCLLVVLVTQGSKGISPPPSQTLHESEPCGSGWASVMISNIPVRLRECWETCPWSHS